MSRPAPIHFRAVDEVDPVRFPGRIAVFAGPGGVLAPLARKLDRPMRGALARFLASEAFAALKPGDGADLAFPAGLAAEAVQVIRLDLKRRHVRRVPESVRSLRRAA